MWYYVYVLFQPSRNKLYIGLTENLNRRIKEHQRNKTKSTKSKKEKPKIIFFEGFISKKDAQRREKYFKTTKGKRVLKLMLKSSFSENQSQD